MVTNSYEDAGAPTEDELQEFETKANAPGAGKIERALFRLIVLRLVREVRRLRLLDELNQEAERDRQPEWWGYGKADG